MEEVGFYASNWNRDIRRKFGSVVGLVSLEGVVGVRLLRFREGR